MGDRIPVGVENKKYVIQSDPSMSDFLNIITNKEHNSGKNLPVGLRNNVINQVVGE